MASGNRSRPSSLPPGSALSDYYRVEGLWRLAEGRMYYLVTDERPDRPVRRCWECGDESTPTAPGNDVCAACGASLAPRRFLVSSRWHRPGFEAYLAYFQRQVAHPALLTPCDVFQWPEGSPVQLCSVVPYEEETLLLDEAAPFTVDRLVVFAQRAAGLIARLAHAGVRLGSMHRSNFCVRPNGDIVMFDPDVAHVQEAPLEADAVRETLGELGGILRRYTPPEATGWAAFFAEVESGAFATVAAFGKALQIEGQRARNVGSASTHAGMTDVGLHRPLNEDNWGWERLAPGIDLFVVADGMGGHDCGEVASEMAVAKVIETARARVAALDSSLADEIAAWVADGDTPLPGVEAVENILDEACQTANNAIKSNAESRGNDMGTTLVACIIVHDIFAICANVGDSRGYLVRGGSLHQVTRDHSLVQKMVEQGRLTAEEARHHPHSNILLRTVGTERNVEIDVFRVELEPGDRILLCSDGLWGEVEDADMEAILDKHADSRVAACELIHAAHHGGGKDNITLILAGVPASSADGAATPG
jgi:serine/threonine protein phosphatase PrpC